MKPIIGVIPLWDDEKESIWMLPDYMNVLEDNNAIPIMFPLSTDKTNLDRCYDMVDGILYAAPISDLVAIAVIFILTISFFIKLNKEIVIEE